MIDSDRLCIYFFNRFIDIEIFFIYFSELFNGLYKLEELNMEQNHLRTISDRSFRHLKKLKIIKLSNNHLTLQSTSFEYIDPLIGIISPFHDCTQLEELYLANNNISKIFGDWITTDIYLRKLDLSHNNISSIKVSNWEAALDLKKKIVFSKVMTWYLLFL